jgi:hypothetical protein
VVRKQRTTSACSDKRLVLLTTSRIYPSRPNHTKLEESATMLLLLYQLFASLPHPDFPHSNAHFIPKLSGYALRANNTAHSQPTLSQSSAARPPSLQIRQHLLPSLIRKGRPVLLPQRVSPNRPDIRLRLRRSLPSLGRVVLVMQPTLSIQHEWSAPRTRRAANGEKTLTTTGSRSSRPFKVVPISSVIALSLTTRTYTIEIRVVSYAAHHHSDTVRTHLLPANPALPLPLLSIRTPAAKPPSLYFRRERRLVDLDEVPSTARTIALWDLHCFGLKLTLSTFGFGCGSTSCRSGVGAG